MYEYVLCGDLFAYIYIYVSLVHNLLVQGTNCTGESRKETDKITCCVASKIKADQGIAICMSNYYGEIYLHIYH